MQQYGYLANHQSELTSGHSSKEPCPEREDDITRQHSSIGERLGALQGYLAGLILRNGHENQFCLPPVDQDKDDRERYEKDRGNTDRLTPASSDDDSLDYPVRSLDIESYRTLVDDCKTTDNFAPLQEFLEQTFCCFVEMSSVFKKDPKQENARPEDPDIKTELLFEVYDSFDSLPGFVTKSVLKAVISSLLELDVRLMAKDDVRSVYMLLLNPIFATQASYTVFAHLVRRVVSLPSPDHQLLIHWFTKTDAPRTRELVKRLLQFITIREFPPANGHRLPSINKSRWWIPCATRVLALLNAANNRLNPPLVEYAEFYNSALDHINLMAEYYRWQTPGRSNKFSYCQYPFILSIVAKKFILQRDSEQQMILNARRSLLNRALQHQVPDIDVFFLNLNIRRSHLVSDSLHEIARKQADLKKKLKVTFVGEPGLDMGGLTKEWFLLLIRQIFSSDYGMFVYHNKARCYWFSTAQIGNLREYNLIGVLMGLAVYNSIILDLNFPTACYRKLLSPPVVPANMDTANVGNCKFTLDDLSEVMPDVVVGLRELLAYEGNVEEDFVMHFEASVDEFGEVKTHILKEGGEQIAVTNENRQEYVDLYVDLILNEAINQPFRAFYLGFHSVCASNALIMLRPEEVELLVCGWPKLDLDALRKVTVYDGFKPNDLLIEQLWTLLDNFSVHLQQQFLRFCTGSDRVPVGGMSEMTFKISAINHNTEMQVPSR
ncbi:putative E3 ubiquitin-protein ligase HECTD2-like [Tropilaelaps mercedesae]|uniref:HECT-type E3 ubiquitin transferase n=1 Tax=Tropilaelaps mercedesae TaxID=418985 RepID=A0A1V9XVC7_9ACAR|nr:putative E3 ubiquitin-protein ligase HECTD2-like [Tropilaelaps mercedesae]